MIPIANSLLYIQPLYVESSRNQIPLLQQVIAVYGNDVAIDSTLAGALTQVFAAPVTTAPGSQGGTGSLSPQVRSLLDQAQQAYQQSQTDLKAGNLGSYQTDIDTLEGLLNEVQSQTGGTVTPTTTTTTTSPGGS